MIGRSWNGIGNVDEEQAKRQQRGDADVDLLRRDAVEDGEQHGGREDAGQDDVHDIELVASMNRHREGDVGKQLRRTAFEVELVTLHARSDDHPFTVFFVAA